MATETHRRAVWCELVHEVARNKGEVRLRAAGASMLPAIWPGDLVSIEHCDFSQLQPGQIILHGNRPNLTLHRIARIAPDHLVTRGDSLPDYDPPVMPENILGRVVSISRHGRNVSPEQSPWQRAVAWFFRQSRFFRRVTAYLHRRLQRIRTTPPRLVRLPH